MDLAVERRSDGAIVLRSRIPLQEFEPCLPRVLAAQAARLGDKPYLVQRRGPQRAWTPHSYADTKRDTDAIAQWLLNRGIARDRPILLLSGNSIAHALVKFGGMAVGVPACPVSANYGLMDSNFARLRHVVQLTRPGVVFVENARPFARALEQVDFGDAIVLTATPEDAPRGAESLARRARDAGDRCRRRANRGVARRRSRCLHADLGLDRSAEGRGPDVREHRREHRAGAADDRRGGGLARHDDGLAAVESRFRRVRQDAHARRRRHVCTSTKANRFPARCGRNRCATCARLPAATT